MKQVNKAILVPVLSAVALLVKFVIGYEIPDVAVDLTSDIIMGIISLVGIFMNPKKQEVSQDNGSTFPGGFNK